MIYGRRFFEADDRKYLVEEPTRGAVLRRPQPIRLLYRNFQIKYTLFLLAAIAGSMLIFVGPAWYFISQNYGIFSQLAYDTQPALLEHLEREKSWLLFLFIFTEIATMGFAAWVGLRVTSRLVGPIWSLEKHMKKVTLGDWTSEDFKIRRTDDFQSLANTYSYLYRSLRAQTEQEIKMLEKLVVDPKDHSNYSTWKTLIDSKKSQLGWLDKSNVGSVEWTSSSPDQRRAS